MSEKPNMLARAADYLRDNLVNATTGMGTARDPRTGNEYKTQVPLNQQQLSNAWRSSGLTRKIVKAPAFDMVREWREWKTEPELVTLLEKEEKRLKIRQKVLQAEVLRGRGGGALILGLTGEPAQEAKPGGIGSLVYVNVVSRWQLDFSEINDDPRTEFFGEPVMWQMSLARGGTVKIHPSRVIAFRADTTGALADTNQLQSDKEAYWGESTIAQVLDCVKDFDTGRSSFATMIQKASRLRIGIPDLMELVSTEAGTQLIKDRITTMVTGESMHNATIYDAGDGGSNPGETLGDVEYSFTGAKDMMQSFGDIVCAVADIPATRLFGRAPEGLNSSGSSQQDDWDKMVKAKQELDLDECMNRLDVFLIPSATGKSNDDGAIYSEWSPLDTPTQKEVSERFKTEMEAVEKLQQSSLVPDRALAEGVQSLLMEEGYLPGLQSALEGMSDDERFGLAVEANPGAADPAKFNNAQQTALAANDAAPKTLYVSRALQNADEFIAWAKGQGFPETISADDLHVTVIYSEQALDWFSVDGIWGDAELTIPAGGPRAVERFGEGAIVLQFASSQLSWRHEELKRAGARSTWPDFNPHVTITYNTPADFDLSAVQPYEGELRFGPERWREVDVNWKSKVAER